MKACQNPPEEPEGFGPNTGIETTAEELTEPPETTEETVEELPGSGGPGRIALASWYGGELEGSLQANGEPFQPWALTVASWDYPLGTVLLICEDFCTTATVTDRGPAFWTGKDIDLSLGVAYRSGLLEDGTGLVYVEEL